MTTNQIISEIKARLNANLNTAFRTDETHLRIAKELRDDMIPWIVKLEESLAPIIEAADEKPAPPSNFDSVRKHYRAQSGDGAWLVPKGSLFKSPGDSEWKPCRVTGEPSASGFVYMIPLPEESPSPVVLEGWTADGDWQTREGDGKWIVPKGAECATSCAPDADVWDISFSHGKASQMSALYRLPLKTHEPVAVEGKTPGQVFWEINNLPGSHANWYVLAQFQKVDQEDKARRLLSQFSPNVKAAPSKQEIASALFAIYENTKGSIQSQTWLAFAQESINLIAGTFYDSEARRELGHAKDLIHNLEHEVDNLKESDELTSSTLLRAGWTYVDGAQSWKPPIGPSKLPLIEAQDRVRELEDERDSILIGTECEVLKKENIRLEGECSRLEAELAKLAPSTRLVPFDITRFLAMSDEEKKGVVYRAGTKPMGVTLLNNPVNCQTVAAINLVGGATFHWKNGEYALTHEEHALDLMMPAPAKKVKTLWLKVETITQECESYYTSYAYADKSNLDVLAGTLVSVELPEEESK